jgi:ubiquitin carboxyl-terminal hydrolase 34
VYGKLPTLFEVDTLHSEIFPAGQPFKCLYAIHALREYILEQSRKVGCSCITWPEITTHRSQGTANDAALTRAISLIVSAISDQDVLLQCATDDLRDYLALQMITCLVDFLRGIHVTPINRALLTLKEPLLPMSIAPFLNETLLQRLLQLLYDAKTTQTARNSAHLTCRSFEAMLEASSHNPEFWRAFSAHMCNTPLLRQLVFEDSRTAVRKSIIKQIGAKCAFSPR